MIARNANTINTSFEAPNIAKNQRRLSDAESIPLTAQMCKNQSDKLNSPPTKKAIDEIIDFMHSKQTPIGNKINWKRQIHFR
jgi:hypothetical protein